MIKENPLENINLKEINWIQKEISTIYNKELIIITKEGKFIDLNKGNTSIHKLLMNESRNEVKLKKYFLKIMDIPLNCEEPSLHSYLKGINMMSTPIIIDGEFLGLLNISDFRIKEDNIDLENISIKYHIDINDLNHMYSNLISVEKDTLDLMKREITLLSGMINRIIKSEIEKYNLKSQLEESKLKNFESLVNPHFLFNTLNSISRMALFENADKTEEMIYDLSDLLRYNLDQSQDFPTIGSELNIIEKYLKMQQIRYGNRIKYSFDLPKELESYRIPSMILQPLVENSIQHGLHPKEKGGNITIKIRKENDDLSIIVKDTGVGMDHKQIDHVLNNQNSSHGLGVYNSNFRLKKYFGDSSKLMIMSEKDFNTIVKFKLPIINEFRPYLQV